jgi:hypothetical protein
VFPIASSDMHDDIVVHVFSKQSRHSAQHDNSSDYCPRTHAQEAGLEHAHHQPLTRPSLDIE